MREEQMTGHISPNYLFTHGEAQPVSPTDGNLFADKPIEHFDVPPITTDVPRIGRLDEEPTPVADSVADDPINHPSHYTSHPSGVECIDITEHMGFNLGNVVKYVWRADVKGSAIDDLRKAVWYLEREIARRSR